MDPSRWELEKRYQVFVSSTYQDLQKERQEVMHALLELDCIPSGMELFPAANADQWTVIKKVIEECDYYLVIVGGRYGTIGPEGLSYTEMEYRYATEIGKPCIAFLHNDPGELAAKRTETSEDGRKKLEAFRNLLQKKLCKMWSNPDDLGSVVSRSLVRQMKTEPAIGWVRADLVPDEGANAEILGLRKKIEELEDELKMGKTAHPEGTEEYRQGEDLVDLIIENPSANRRVVVAASWNDIIKSIGPMMIDEESEENLRVNLRDMLATKGGFTEGYLVYLNRQSFDTVLVQLRALRLITKGTKKRSAADTETYWALSPYGDSVVTQLVAQRREDVG